jgi:tetratricopeptide (TPR) repeat protein
MEKVVHALIEESAQAGENHEFGKALEKAKEAGKKERALCKHREANGLSEQINFDLTYAVVFNLANVYQQNGMMTEALNTYTLVVKNKQYPQSGRLRVNMGNIYFYQKKYPQAIKMYRMALDQIPNSGKEVRARALSSAPPRPPFSFIVPFDARAPPRQTPFPFRFPSASSPRSRPPTPNQPPLSFLSPPACRYASRSSATSATLSCGWASSRTPSRRTSP